MYRLALFTFLVSLPGILGLTWTSNAGGYVSSGLVCTSNWCPSGCAQPGCSNGSCVSGNCQCTNCTNATTTATTTATAADPVITCQVNNNSYVACTSSWCSLACSGINCASGSCSGSNCVCTACPTTPAPSTTTTTRSSFPAPLTFTSDADGVYSSGGPPCTLTWCQPSCTSLNCTYGAFCLSSGSCKCVCSTTTTPTTTTTTPTTTTTTPTTTTTTPTTTTTTPTTTTTTPTTTPAPVTQVTCENSAVKLSCPTGKKINVISAAYGRTQDSVCVGTGPTDNTNCESPTALSTVQNICQDASECVVSASNAVFSEPCSGTSKYLNVSYNCVPSTGTPVVTCESSTMNLVCPQSGQIITIESAYYGRMDSTTCNVGLPVDNTLCSGDNVKSFVQNACQGEPSCSVDASFSNFGDPCPGTYKYLKVVYSCQYPPE